MIAFVWGTRPEAIKLGPVVAELRALGVNPAIFCTGQHTELLQGTPAETDLADGGSFELGTAPDVWKWVEGAVPVIRSGLERAKASLVVVQGDTMSAFAGAKAAFGAGIPVAHVEAGLRSGTLAEPWPEEGIRRRIAMLATWHLAPTERSRENLRREGISDADILVTGNPVVSAIARYSDATPRPVPDPHLLITMHRREWLNQGQDFVQETIAAVVETALACRDAEFIWPMHPGVRKIAGEGFLTLVDDTPNLSIVEPMRYRETLNVVSRAIGVATDSGGLSEEAATLGVPCAVLRNVTDRPESLAAGLAKLYPPSPEGVRAGIAALLQRKMPRNPSNCFGDRDSALRIARFLAA